MATRSLKDVRIIPKGASRHAQTGPTPFPLLILVLIIMLIFLARLRPEGPQSLYPIALRAALPETIQ